MNEALLVERDGHVVTLTMNRPQVKNASTLRCFVGWQMPGT
jgi:enoyl-CoA hydratase/carnithine racemase